ncbi:acetate/propionate family kinase [Luteolibacter yonseiensis]|uniref:Acetate kinase n=1 Tax=Luteolibacter yonseiensis TaxID=1144680 RepID=A0A934V8X8_9BACT|nr:acetate/propionate family kinase [Luteolibacter yonseiensis]MBK1814583.1 acetate/propionate family kinase [Luteolibacter yonseiensis]
MNATDLEFLKSRVTLFANFSDARREEIAKGSRIEFFGQGTLIADAGDEFHFLGVVMDGTITASVQAADGGRQDLGRLGPGDTFGEMALLSGDPMLADLTAESACRVLLVPLTLFQSHIMAEPRAVRHISRTIGQRFQRAMGDPATAAALTNKEDVSGLLELKGERPECVLVLNCGSSSLKYSIFDTRNPDDTVHGHIESIGTYGTRLVQRGPKGVLAHELPQGGYAEAFGAMLSALMDPHAQVIREASAISAVGHRVVHGGRKFTGAVLIDDVVLAGIELLSPLAPLHNPLNAAGIREARRVFPAVPHVAVFDTAFHATLPSHAYLYGLPNEYYEDKGIRRYGFHGLSHNYVSLAAARFLKRRPREFKIVSCHLGSGASVCAIDHGRSVDTSMGFTPGEGLIMGTRCGDIDSGVLAFLARTEGLSAAQIDDLLNKQSGLFGLSGISSDMREVEQEADAGDAEALAALKTFCYRVRKYIGAYIAAMGGLDVLIFTAGIGQGSAGVRATALQGLRCMGILLDEERNRAASGGTEITRISSDTSPVTVLVVPTDEERMIARETLRTLSRDYLVRTSEACRTEPIPIEVSAHHIHLTQQHVEALFGAGHQLTHHSDLSQPGQFACKEQLTIVGPKGRIERVRVLGPVRKATQVEIAMTEQFKLGIHPPIRESGDIDGSPGCTLEGPSGSVTIDRGVICALRHIHMTPADALRYGIKDKSTVRVRVAGDRELLFGDVRIRVDPHFALAMHIDTDEANAANLKNGAEGFIVGIQTED